MKNRQVIALFWKYPNLIPVTSSRYRVWFQKSNKPLWEVKTQTADRQFFLYNFLQVIINEYWFTQHTDFFAFNDGSRMYESVLVDTDFFQIFHYSTPVWLPFESVFETFGTLIAECPSVFFAYWCIERFDDVHQRHTIVLV